MNNQELFEYDRMQPSYKDIENFFLNSNLTSNLRNKIVYCNCDNPFTSLLFKYLCLNFSKLGLNKLVTTDNGEDLNNKKRYEVLKQPPVLFINRSNFNVNYMLKYNFISSEDIGDTFFNSKDCIVQTGRSDVIITKPPVDKIDEYFGIIANSDKNFILLIPFEKTTEFNLFRNIKHSKAKINCDVDFNYVSYNKENLSKTKFSDICILTNINITERPSLVSKNITNSVNNKRSNKFRKCNLFLKKLNICFKKKIFSYSVYENKKNKKVVYSESLQNLIKEKYLTFDNYNAIAVDDINNIPYNYEGVIGVPLVFLKHYNPEEFEIVGLSKERLNKEESLKFNQDNNEFMPIIKGVKEDSYRVFITRRKNYASKDLDWYRDNIFKKYTEDELIKQLNDFVNQEHDLSDISNKGKSYNKIINQFLEEVIYSARKSKVKYSPVDSLNDDALLTRIINYIAKKPRFFCDTNPIINLKRFYSGACKIAPKVANFSPNAACKIYERLCPKKGANIYDYSCGFGARMLGCICSKYNYNYFGTDPNERLCIQLNKLGSWVKENIDKPNTFKVYCQGSEYFISELEGKIDLAFSSPPYFDLEVYTNDDKQCENKYGNNYSAWLEFYVKPTVQNIKRYLKEDGIFALNIKNGTYGGYEHLLDDWTKCAEDEGFEIIDELTMKHQSARIALSNYMVKKYGDGYALKSGTEPVRVFKLKKIEVNNTESSINIKKDEHKQLSLF